MFVDKNGAECRPGIWLEYFFFRARRATVAWVNRTAFHSSRFHPRAMKYAFIRPRRKRKEIIQLCKISRRMSEFTESHLTNLLLEKQSPWPLLRRPPLFCFPPSDCWVCSSHEDRPSWCVISPSGDVEEIEKVSRISSFLVHPLTNRPAFDHPSARLSKNRFVRSWNGSENSAKRRSRIFYGFQQIRQKIF